MEHLSNERMMAIARSKALCEFCFDSAGDACLSCGLAVPVASDELRRFWSQVVQLVAGSPVRTVQPVMVPDADDENIGSQCVETEPAQVEEIVEIAVPVPPSRPVAAKPEPSSASKEAIRPYHGFVYLRCPHCYAERAFAAKSEMTDYVCKQCGEGSPLPPATVAITECKCGQKSHYLTNIGDWAFDIPCVKCGAPAAVEWSCAAGRYIPAGSRGRKPRKKKQEAQ